MPNELLAHALCVGDDASADAEQGRIGRRHPRVSLVALELDVTRRPPAGRTVRTEEATLSTVPQTRW